MCYKPCCKRGTRTRLVVLAKSFARRVIESMSPAYPVAAWLLVMLLSCCKSIKVKLVMVVETVNLAIVLEKLVFSREANVMIVAYPMPLRLLKVLVQSSA